MNPTGTIIAGKLFSDIRVDERVTRELNHCLYCRVSQSGSGDEHWHKDINYKIPLECINGSAIKQCPACRFVYILRGPVE